MNAERLRIKGARRRRYIIPPALGGGGIRMPVNFGQLIFQRNR